MIVKEKALIRALNYEEKSRTTGKKLVVECLKEKEREWGERREGKWANIRQKTLEDEGYGREASEKYRQEGGIIAEQVMEKIREREKIRRERIENSTYNKEYKILIKEEKPKYLCKKMKSKDRKTIARFRCGNEVREREHWKEEEEKQCRLCRKEIESLWHVLKECDKTRQEEKIEKVLGEDGQGLKILRLIEKMREREKTKKEKRGERMLNSILLIYYC